MAGVGEVSGWGGGPFRVRAAWLGGWWQRLSRRDCRRCRKVEIVPPHWREALQVGPNEVFYRGTGCRKCEGLDVHGRIAVYELMTISPAIRRLIRPQCEADAIHEAALQEGMIPITRNAVELARSGTISLTEAFRLRAD